MSRVFITGDCHGDFEKIERFVEENDTNQDDILIILGDVKLNYFENSKDVKRKRKLSNLPLTFLLIHGNHEIRPENIHTYNEKEWCGGVVYYENKYPNLLFAKDASIFNLNGKSFFICGGAYSVDKWYRLGNGILWCEDEQPSEFIKADCERALTAANNSVDYILTHTCPIDYLPRDTFKDEIDQSTVDTSTEVWLQKIENNADYETWFCGHYHIDRISEKIFFVFDHIIKVA